MNKAEGNTTCQYDEGNPNLGYDMYNVIGLHIKLT